MISAWKKAHPVVEEARVVDGGATWDYFIDVGDKTDTEKGKGKKGAGEVESDSPLEEMLCTISPISKKKMLLIFPDFSCDDFVTLYEEVRIDKQ